MVVLTGFSVRPEGGVAKHKFNQHQYANRREERGFVAESSVGYSLVRIRVRIVCWPRAVFVRAEKREAKKMAREEKETAAKKDREEKKAAAKKAQEEHAMTAMKHAMKAKEKPF